MVTMSDLLLARLKARASSQRIMLKQLLRNYVEQGLNTAAEPHKPQPSPPGFALLGAASL